MASSSTTSERLQMQQIRSAEVNSGNSGKLLDVNVCNALQTKGRIRESGSESQTSQCLYSISKQTVRHAFAIR